MKTTGEVATALGEPLHRVQYVLRTRKIGPDQRAGNLQLFGPAKVKQIRKALMDSARKVSK